MDFGWHMEVASLEATEEIMAVASFPQAPYVSTTIGTHTIIIIIIIIIIIWVSFRENEPSLYIYKTKL